MTTQEYRKRVRDSAKGLPVNPNPPKPPGSTPSLDRPISPAVMALLVAGELTNKKYVCDLIDKVSGELKNRFAIPFGHWDDDVAEAVAGTMEACVAAFQGIKEEIKNCSN